MFDPVRNLQVVLVDGILVQAIGLAEALQYMMNIGLENISEYEHYLTQYAIEEFSKIKGFNMVGKSENKGGVFSFVVDGIHPQDLAFILDKEGISVRVGHHCAAPLVRRLGYESLVRASLGLYNTTQDIDILCTAINKAKTFF